MGSWTELDAIYPPGRLTPATVLVVALGRLAGATSLYTDGRLATFLPTRLSYDADLLGRAERYLGELSLDDFLAEARALLSARQRLVVALQLLDYQLAAGDPPERRDLAAQLLAGLGLEGEVLSVHRATLAIKNDLDLFPQ
jgi:hypothetical protein